MKQILQFSISKHYYSNYQQFLSSQISFNIRNKHKLALSSSKLSSAYIWRLMKIILIEGKRTLCPFLASIMIRYSTICHCVVLYGLIIGILNVFLLLKVSWTCCPVFRQIYNEQILTEENYWQRGPQRILAWRWRPFVSLAPYCWLQKPDSPPNPG